MHVITVDIGAIKGIHKGDSQDDDALTKAELASIAPSRFWDECNRRPIHSTAGRSVIDSVVPARDQGGRWTCVAFALVAALEARLLRSGIAEDLSEQHAAAVLARSAGRRPDDPDELIRLYDAIGILSGQKICFEQDCGYELRGSEPDRAAVARARYAITRHFVVPRVPFFVDIAARNPNLDDAGVTNIEYLECILANGYDIALVLHLPSKASMDVEAGIYLPRYFSGSVPIPENGEAFHVVLARGYCRDAKIPHLVCRDSLPGLSGGKPLLLSYEFVRSYASYGVVVTEVSVD